VAYGGDSGETEGELGWGVVEERQWKWEFLRLGCNLGVIRNEKATNEVRKAM